MILQLVELGVELGQHKKTNYVMVCIILEHRLGDSGTAPAMSAAMTGSSGDYSVHLLHNREDLLERTAHLINDEWPRSLSAR